MRGKVIFVNQASRLAAVHVGTQKYIVFEYQGNEHFRKDDELNRLRDEYGEAECVSTRTGKKVKIKILSSAMSYEKAKLVVAPWHGNDLGNITPAY